MNNIYVVAGLITFSILSFAPLSVQGQAQSIKIEISNADDIRAILNKIGNKPVTLVLNSQKEISGKIYNISDRLVHITDLAGKEFYDAVVKIDRIESVIVRARASQ